MGLAERKVKQRIGYDPRNLTWSNDTNRFSFKHMTALGWEENKGIGKAQDGMATHLAVARKMDNTGIGMGRVMRETGEMSAGAGQAGAGLEDVLRRLASRAASTASASPAPSAPQSPAASPAPTAGPSTIRNKIASRQKHLASKRMASQSPAALAEILGVPVSSLPATPATSSPATSAVGTPAASGTSTPAEEDRDSFETVVKSNMSVGDYFRQKLREKAAARAAARAAAGLTAPAPELAEGSLALPKEEKKVAIGGVAWEGSKMAFDDVKTEIADLGGEETHAGLGSVEEKLERKEHEKEMGEVKEKKDKKEKKEKKEKKGKGKEKEKEKEDKASSDSTTDDDKSRRKAEKEARKAEKEARKAEKEAKKAEKEAKKAEKEAKKAEKKDKKRKRSDDDDDDDDGKKKSKSKSKSK